MQQKVLIVIGDASETVDTLYPYHRLIEGGYKPVVAGPEVHRYNMVMHEVKPGWTITREWEGYTIQSDIAFKDINPDDYLGIFFSGGRAPEYIRYDKDLVRVTKHFFEKNGGNQRDPAELKPPISAGSDWSRGVCWSLWLWLLWLWLWLLWLWPSR